MFVPAQPVKNTHEPKVNFNVSMKSNHVEYSVLKSAQMAKPMPKKAGIDIVSRFIPSRSFSGELCCVHQDIDDRILFIIGTMPCR
ncbi:MAG: hypothetical protein JW795_00275, partial [Chitinivibrionales bacterium]|nr:hypothetical protein [Chitinivibrionales bacterium]